MSRQLLIYNEVIPVSFSRHSDLSIKATGRYDFARHVNSVPLVASEILPASAEYPVVFAVGDDGAFPVALFGVDEGLNLYVGDDGRWLGRYVPAFLRRYPFVFSTADEGRKLTLCVDESYEGCNREGRGERLFDADGEQTQHLKSTLEFLQQYQVEFERTRQFCKSLQQQGLLEPMSARFNLPDGAPRVLGGFSSVSRPKLRALAPDALQKMAQGDELELAYAQMHSMTHFANLVERLGARAGAGAGGAPLVAAGAEMPQAG